MSRYERISGDTAAFEQKAASASLTEGFLEAEGTFSAGSAQQLRRSQLERGGGFSQEAILAKEGRFFDILELERSNSVYIFFKKISQNVNFSTGTATFLKNSSVRLLK